MLQRVGVMDGLGRKGEKERQIRERDEGEDLWPYGHLDSDGFVLEKWKGWKGYESWDLGEVNACHKSQKVGGC